LQSTFAVISTCLQQSITALTPGMMLVMPLLRQPQATFFPDGGSRLNREETGLKIRLNIQASSGTDSGTG
jgi:hypothetical protein